MSRILNTYQEVDLHIDNLCFMFSQGFIPTYYQLALMKGLAQATEGIVLYFFTELGKRNRKIIEDYFAVDLQTNTNFKPLNRRKKDLESLL